MDAVIKKAIQDAIQRSSLAADQRAALLRRLPELTDAECREVLAALELLQKSYQEVQQELETIELLTPLDIDRLTPDDISRMNARQIALPETRRILRTYIEEVGQSRNELLAGEVEEALHTLLEQQPNLKKTDARAAGEFEELIALTQFFRLSGLSRLQRRNLFQYHLLMLLEIDVDIVAMIDGWLVFLYGAEGLGEDLQAAIIGIYNNKQRIGNAQIERDALGTLSSTIQNWLTDYDYIYPRERTRGSVEAGEYLTKRSKTINQLTPKEQRLLKRLIQTVDALLFPTRYKAVQGHDVLPRRPLAAPADTGPKRLAKVPMKKPAAVSLAQEPKTLEDKLLDNFKGSVHVPGRKEESVVSVPLSAPSVIMQLRGKPADERKIEAVKQQLRSMGPSLAIRFHDVIAPPKGVRASRETHIAALLLLAETNKLEDLLRSQGMHDWFVDYLKALNKPELLEGFRIAPTSPKFMRIFLSWILQDRAGLTEAEAARFGARIVSMLRKQGNEKYAQIAYYDEGKGRFTWN